MIPFHLCVNGKSEQSWLIGTACLVVSLTFSPFSLADSPAAENRPSGMTMSEIGAAASEPYSGERLSVKAKADGAVLRCLFQRLEGEATPEGLWLVSTVESQNMARFSVKAVSLGRALDMNALSDQGAVAVEDSFVRWSRPGLVEEYSSSVDGVRQDFVIPEKPAGVGPLRLSLSVSGAKAETIGEGVAIVLDGSGRRLVYGKLNATDAAGKELPARLAAEGETRLAIVVEDAGAAYPIRIDPTFSDANWVSMGGMQGATRCVYAIAVDTNAGVVYFGGEFTNAGDVAANNIAKWNGSAWGALGSGLNNAVIALALDGSSNLYVGGTFTTAGGVSANRIAKWNKSAWSTLGSGMNNSVYALALDSSSNLYAGGWFTSAGGVSANRIAKWNKSAWSTLGSGMNSSCLALAMDGTDNLYAGGQFTSAGDVSVNHIAQWNGSVWSAVGSGLNYYVKELAVDAAGNLYAGGQFFFAGEVPVNRIAKWDGSAWSALGSGVNDTIYALALDGTGNLYAGGDFTSAGDISANKIAKWNGREWSALGSGMNNPVDALALDGMGNLYAGGAFTIAGTNVSECVARAILPPKENQVITFPLIPEQLATNIVGLRATASSGLAVTFAVTNGPGIISDGTNLSFTGTGTVSVVASQGGDVDWNPAPEVTNTVEVFAGRELSVIAINGNAVKIPDASAYAHGSSVSLTGISNAGYHFRDWSGDASGTDNPISVIMDSNKSITAHFALNVITALTDRASVSVPEGGTTNFQVKLSAQPTGDTVVAVARVSGDADITVSGGASLTFSTGNWDVWQNVFLSAAEDDGENQYGSVTISCSGVGVTNASVQAIEIDDDYYLLIIKNLCFAYGWGSNGSGDGQFNLPIGMAVGTDGLIYVADTSNHRIQVFEPDGTFVRKWGSQGSGDGQFNNPYGLAMGTNGLIYVADTSNHRIQVFEPDGTFVRKWGGQGSGDGQLNGPRAITVATNGLIYVADAGNHRIQVFEPDGTFVQKWGGQGAGDGQFFMPGGIVAGRDGLIYVADTGNYRIQVFQPDGAFFRKWGSQGLDDGQFNLPYGIEMGTDGSIYVADYSNNRIQNFQPDGAFIRKWGSQGLGDGQFNGPRAMAVNTNGQIFVADRLNYRIQVFQPEVNGAVTKTPDAALYDNGTSVSLEAIPNTNAHFTGWSGAVTGLDNPVSVLMDSNKNVAAGFALNTVTVLTDRASVTVPEGGTANFQVRLNTQPTGDTVVVVSRTAGDVDIGVSEGGSLTFTTGNWADYQTVTVAAAEDNSDNSNGVAAITCSGIWLTDAIVEASEIDDDHVLSLGAVNGTIAKSPDTPFFDHGSGVTLTPVPDVGYHFTDWAGDAAGVSNPIVLTMDGDKNVTAHFALSVITVLTDRASVLVPEGGNTNFQVKLSAQPTGDVFVAVARTSGDADIAVTGSALTFTTNNWAVYQVVALSADEDNGDNIAGTAIITCSGPGITNAVVEATEADDDFTLTLTSLYGSVAIDPDSAYYDNGTVVTLTATPAMGYYWIGYSGDLTDTNNPVSIAMDADKSVTVNYGPNAPQVLPPKTIGKKNFTARWKWVENGAPEGQLSVALDNAFTMYAAGYQDRYVANATECLVTNLIAGRDYRYRIRRVMPDGSWGPWSLAMKVRTGVGMPAFKHLLSDVPVSKGISQEFAITNLMSGTGTLRVKSSNTNAVKATVSSGALTLRYLWKGANTAKVTMTLTHPTSGYKVSYGATLTQATGSVAKVGQSALTNAGIRVAQEVTLKNKTGGMIYGIRVRVKGLDNPAWLINRTGFDPVSKAPILEIPCVLPAGSQMVVRLVYNKAYKTQAVTRPVKYAAWAIMTPVSGAGPVSREMIISKQDLYDGLWLLGMPANRNRLYRVYYSDDNGTTWTVSMPLIRTTANYLNWMDLDEGAPSIRLYRVVDAGM